MKKFVLFFTSLFIFAVLHADPLPANEAFQFGVRKIDPNTFALEWTIKPGYFLYSDRIHLVTQPESNINLGVLRLPATLTKTDKLGHVYTIYRNQLSIPVDVLGTQPGESLMELSYQGCSDDGFCYPPEKLELQIGIDPTLELSSIIVEKNEVPAEVAKESNENEINKIFTDHNLFMTLLIFYGLGLLLSFTPCILPMVPVLSGIIVGHGTLVTTKKAFFLSLSYVLSMSFTYAAVGAVVALLGENLQINMQSPWAISIFSLVFILLAFSMFGLYEFKLPQAWQAKIAGSSRNQRGGHYIGAAIMGCLSTLILSPCVTAPLIGVLTYIAQSHNILLGCLTLFVLSLGMGTPLLLIGTSAGKLLPKAGAWMNAIKALFGVLLLGISIYLLERIVPNNITMFLWACLLIFSGIYTGAFHCAQTHGEKCKQGLGIIFFSYGLLILVGTSMGATNPLQPLSALRYDNELSKDVPISQLTVSSLEEQIKNAKGTPVMLDFYADWCSSCKVIENTTFKDPVVQELLSHFKIIKIDVTHNTFDDKEIMHRFDVVAPPTFIFYDTLGKKLNELKVVGETSTSQFIKILQRVN